MLRTLFVLGILAIGFRYSFKHPFYVLLFYLWLAYFRPEQWLWWDFLSSWRLSTVLGVWLPVMTMFSAERFRFGLGPALLAAFLGQCVLSTGLSPVASEAWGYVVEFAKVMLVSYMMVVLVTTEERLRQTLIVIGVSLGFEGAKQGWGQLVLHPGAINVNPWPMLGDNNGVAVGMLMLTALLVCLAATATATWEKRLFRFMSIGTTYRALSTYSRGGFLACCALGLHYFAWSRRRLRTVLALVVVAAIITPALPDSFWMRMRTIETVVPTSSTSLMPGGEEPDDSISGRLHFWSVATSMAADRPFIGVGQNAYNSVYDRYDWSYGRYGFGRSVHSSWFGVLAELGYPGLLLFATLFVGAFATTMRVRHAAKSLPELRNVAAYATAIEASLIVFVVGGAFVPFQYNEMVWHLLALSMAVGRLATAKLGAPTPSVPLSRVSPDVRPAARGRLV